MYFLPLQFFVDVIIGETNKVDEAMEDITPGEFMVYIGLWILMSTTASGCDRRSYWENSPISPWSGAPFQFNEYMSYTRFNAIAQNLTFTNIAFPTWRDKFHEVRQMIAAWNKHMAKVFTPGWISCLDESMSI